MLYWGKIIVLILLTVEDNAKTMPSSKVVNILLSRTDLSKDHIVELSEMEAWNIVYSLDKKKDRE